MKKYVKISHGNNIESVFLGTDEQWAIKQGYALTDVELGTDGNWYILGQAPTPSTEELFSRLRSERDVRLSAVLWMRERHADELELGKETSLTPEQYTALLTYIQALRDLPAQPGAPWDGGGELTPWPEVPEV